MVMNNFITPMNTFVKYLLIFTTDSIVFLYSDWYCIMSDSLVIIKSRDKHLIY